MMGITVRDAAVTEATVRRAASGDEAALALLIAEHHDPMVEVAYVIIGDAELAREAAQVAWTVARRRMHGLRDLARIRPRLVAIAANEARGLVRREPAQDGRRVLPRVRMRMLARTWRRASRCSTSSGSCGR